MCGLPGTMGGRCFLDTTCVFRPECDWLLRVKFRRSFGHETPDRLPPPRDPDESEEQ